MRQTRPLPDTHPEFSVVHWQGFTEYRIEHWRLARDGSGRVVPGACVWSWVDAVVMAFAASVLLAWLEVQVPTPGHVPAPRPSSYPIFVAGIGIVLTYLVWARFTQVLHESLFVFPDLGIQLETHRGHPLLPPLTTTRHFIPLSALEDVIVHEGFWRWNVRYYLAALYRTRPEEEGEEEERRGDVPSASGTGIVRVRVAFEHVRPYFPVLKAVYLGVQESLFPPLTLVVDDPSDPSD